MAEQLTERVLLHALRCAKKGERPSIDLGEDFRKSLEILGMVKFGWDVSITEFGQDILNHLESKDDWGS